MKKILLYGFGGSYNHGGEAIVQTTTAYLREKYPDAHICLSTHFREQDEEFCLPVDEYLERDMRYVELDRKSAEKGLYDREIYRSTIEAIDRDTLCFSVGGDNYCYPNWHRWKTIHDAALAAGAKDTLWGCSVEPSAITAEMLAHLSTFHLITARESITYNALRDSGLTNVSLCRDPAFSLREEPTELPPGFAAHNTVAVNVSPLVLRREPSEGILMQNLLRVMSWILSETDMHILLLPHVVMPSDNDLEPLRILEGAFRQRGCAERVCLVEENLSAAQRKYLIARCRFGIFARTHASIAAYSSNVPCLVLGYSVKSRGIGRDMGMEDYVLPISTIDKTDAVLTAFREMMAEEAQLVEVLREKNV